MRTESGSAKMRRHIAIRAIIVCLGWLGVLSGGPTGWTQQPPPCTPPSCFDTVSDIVQGRRLMLPADDLVVTSFGPDNPGPVNNSVYQTTDSGVSDAFEYPILDNAEAFATGVGRMFNLPRDIIITMTGPPGGINVRDQDPNGFITKGFPFPRTPQGMAMADFNADGFADIAVLAGDDPGSTSGLLQIVTANNVNNLDDGLFVSDGVGPQFINFSTPIAITTGDFNGDGRPEVAIEQALPLGGTKILVYIFEVLAGETGTIANHALQQVASVTLDSPLGEVFEVALVAGNYAGINNPDTSLPMDNPVLVLHNGSNLTAQSLKVTVQSTDPLSFDIVPAQTLVIADTLPTSGAGTFDSLKGVKSGRFNWFGATDQVVVASRVLSVLFISSYVVEILTLDSSLNFSVGGSQIYVGEEEQVLDLALTATARPGAVLAIALGNFDNRNSDGTPNFNLEIAVLLGGRNTSPNPFALEIFQVDPTNNFSLTFASNNGILPESRFPCNCTLALVAGDTQGRSLRLGPPEKVTINNDIRPDIILGMPPMHIDWIDPVTPIDSSQYPQYPGCDNPPVPCLLNLTVMPSGPQPGTGGFNTQYTFSSTASTNASRKNTTSWSLSVKVSREQHASFGVPAVASVSDTIKTSAGFTHDAVVAKTYNTYSAVTTALSVITGFEDYLFYTQRQLNIYYYPVIGQTTCAAEQPDCPDSEKLPLYVVYSAPAQFSHNDVPGTHQEWYQPVHEPGNVFSYPGDLTQLQQEFPTNLVLLTQGSTTTWYQPSTSPITHKTTWTATTSEDVTSGSTNTETFSLSISVSGSAGIKGFGADVSNTFDLNQSASVSTLNTSVQTLAASEGIQVNAPAFSGVASDDFYSFAGYVVGVASPAGTLQHIDLQDQQGQPIDIQSSGPLFVGFFADMTNADNQGALWWKLAYGLPDVGLNHPARWDWSGSRQTASFNFAQPSNISPLLQDFYHMKDVFITPAAANGEGPTRSCTVDGDQLLLQARVYNYSLVETTAPVHVRFYGQLYDGSTGNLSGPSFLIGEDVLASIPGFQSPAPGVPPNWVLASTAFNTTGLGGQTGQHFVFWVVVWMQDADGNLVPELPEHGLKAIPGSLSQIFEVQSELYSNNVGMYGNYTPLFIGPQSASLSCPPPNTNGSLSIDSVSLSSTTLFLDHKARVSAPLRTDEQRSGPMLVAYYDGDPQQGGNVFHVHHTSHVAANDTYLSRAIFRPQTCGEHTIFVVAEPASAAPATAKATVDVIIDPVASVQALIGTTQGQGLPAEMEGSLVGKLEAAERAFARGNTKAGTNQLNAYLREVQAQRGKQLTAQQADLLLGQTNVILGCV